MRARGSTLASVLLVLMVAVTLTFVVAQASLTHLQFATGIDNREHARNLAESAINQALGQVLDSDAYGKNRAGGSFVKVTDPQYPAGSYGYLTFNKTEAALERTWWSTNNLGDGSELGDRRPVPPSTVHLVGVGRCGDVQQTVEVLYYRPPYPKALTCTGPINSTGGLYVAALESGAAYPGSPTAIPPNDAERGSIHSNATGNKAIELGAGCNITGNVGAAGQIVLDPTVVVGGEVRADANPQPVPDFDVDRMIYNVADVSNSLSLSGSTSALTVDWYAGSTGNLDVNGDLTLKDGVLWVKGDLKVSGCIKGNGLVLVKGNVTADAGSNLDAQNLVALAASGDVRLHAADQNNFYFQGLVYSEGNIEARQITVLGTVIANGSPGKGRLDLDRVTAVATGIKVQQLMRGIPETARKEKNGVTTEGPYPGQVVVSTPKFAADGKTLKYDVRVRSFAAPTVDQTWSDLDYEPAIDIGRQYNGEKNNQFGGRPRPQVPPMPNAKAVGDTVYRRTDASRILSPDGVINLNLNNLLSPSDRARILLWNTL